MSGAPPEVSADAPIPNLEELRSAEENNFQVSLERLGNTASLVHDFDEGYRAIGRLLRKTKDPAEYLQAVSVLFLSSEYHLEKACLACLRGDLAGSHQVTRQAIEAAAFSARISRHHHLGELWFEASKDDDTWDEFMEKFSPSKIFPEDDDDLSRLRRRWDAASRRSHTNVYSLADRAGIRIEDGNLEFEFFRFGVRNEDESQPAGTLLWTLDTHFGILKIFERVFAEQLGEDNLRAWEVRRNALGLKLGQHKEIWRERIMPAPE